MRRALQGSAAAYGSEARAALSCADLAPAFGPAAEFRKDLGTHAAALGGTSSPDGQIDVVVQSAFLGGAVISLLSPDAAWLQPGSIVASPTGIGGTEIDPWFHWVTGGYHGIVHDPGVTPPVLLRVWDTAGAPLVDVTSLLAMTSAPDGTGGTVLVAKVWDPTKTPPQGATQLAWVDASGHVTRSAVIDADPMLVQVAWGTSHVLTVVPGAPSARARWFDGTGTPLTPWFDINVAIAPTDAGAMHLLLDGTVVLSVAGQWRATFTDAAAHADPAPSWLASRPNTRLATIRQGSGYAVLSALPGGDQDRFEILKPSGETCGWILLPFQPCDPGVVRTPQRLDVGQDGTLIQTVSRTGASLGMGGHAAWRWWPALLR